MRIDVHLHIEPTPEVLGLLGEMSRKLDLILKVEQRMENTMALDFTKIIAAAAKQQGTTNSVLQTLNDLKVGLDAANKALAAAVAANDPAAIKAAQDQLDSIATGIDTNDDAIAAAIAAPGTPGTPPPPNA